MPIPGAYISTDPPLRVRLDEAVDLRRRRPWCHPEEILEKVESLGATRTVGILLKQHHHSMPVVVVLLGSELSSVFFTLIEF